MNEVRIRSAEGHADRHEHHDGTHRNERAIDKQATYLDGIRWRHEWCHSPDDAQPGGDCGRGRRREDEEFEATQWALNHAEAEPQPSPAMAAPEPSFARAAVQPAAAATALPAGFDLSRFGRHVQAAYRGPTPDNPSLSLKNRLRRASFFDQQERRAAEEGKAAARPTQPAWMTRKANEAEFMFRPASRKPELKPAFQK